MRSLYQFLLLILLCSSFSSFAQVPLYDSYPSANATIFLDFDGHYVVGTAWNTNGPISGAPANLNATQIIEVCNRVAEDYRPFNINVTTDSTKYWAAPADQRIRVILTTTSIGIALQAVYPLLILLHGETIHLLLCLPLY